MVLDASAINDLDVDGATAVANCPTALGPEGSLRLATVRGAVRDLVAGAGGWDELGGHGGVCPDLATAVGAPGEDDFQDCPGEPGEWLSRARKPPTGSGHPVSGARGDLECR